MSDTPDLTPISLLNPFLAGVGPKTRKVLTAAALVSAACGPAKGVWDTIRDKKVYAVTVTQGDEIYGRLHAQLLNMLPSSRQKALLFHTERDNKGDDSDYYSKRQGKIELFYDGGVDQTITLSGHKVKITLLKPEMSISNLLEMGPSMPVGGREQLRFIAQSEAGRDAILTLLTSVTNDQYQQSKSRFMVASQWGDWESRMDLPSRHLDTVVLPSVQKERLLNDISQFLAQEDAYAKLGTPWHRGVLLHGIPGSGKTSLARALATHFGLDIYYVPIGDLKTDTSLLRLCSQVQPRSLLLLEDIDILQSSTSREDKEGRTSLSGLLNALDGVSTPHGLITIMTTNDKSKLDPALIRPGRIDIIEEIGYLDDNGLLDLLTLTFEDIKKVPSLNGADISPAEVMEIIKRNFDTPMIALAEVEVLISERGMGS